jgi:hypothetical protein
MEEIKKKGLGTGLIASISSSTLTFGAGRKQTRGPWKLLKKMTYHK